MVRRMISEDTVVENPMATLELFDDLQRLELSYHFKDEISTLLKLIYICHYEAHEKWNRLALNVRILISCKVRKITKCTKSFIV